MSEQGAFPAAEAGALRAALVRLLRPLVRLCLQRGVTFQALSELLREIYVNVAEHDFPLAGKGQTDSRVSLLTGVHRKEVRRLRGAGTPVAAAPAPLSRASRILAHWLASPGYTGAEGLPLRLPRVAPAGTVSFETLVETITKDVRPRAILDEWLARGLVAIDADDRVILQDTALVPPGGEQQLYYFGRNLHDHIAAATANVAGDVPRFLERALHYDGLSPAAVQQLERQIRHLATEALRESNRQAHEVGLADAGGRWRINFGTFVFVEETPPDPPIPPSEGTLS